MDSVNREILTHSDLTYLRHGTATICQWLATNFKNYFQILIVRTGELDKLDLSNVQAGYLQYFTIHDAMDKALSHIQMVSAAAGAQGDRHA